MIGDTPGGDTHTPSLLSIIGDIISYQADARGAVGLSDGVEHLGDLLLLHVVAVRLDERLERLFSLTSAKTPAGSSSPALTISRTRPTSADATSPRWRRRS